MTRSVGAMLGVPAALVLRLVIIASTSCLARYPRLSRWTALGGSMLASAITTSVAMRVIAYLAYVLVLEVLLLLWLGGTT